MEIAEAREILNEDYAALTDEQIEVLIGLIDAVVKHVITTEYRDEISED